MALTKPKAPFESEITDGYQCDGTAGTFVLADASMRAGSLNILELEHLLGSVLSPEAGDSQEQKWPLAYSFALVLASSGLVWAAIILIATRII